VAGFLAIIAHAPAVSTEGLMLERAIFDVVSPLDARQRSPRLPKVFYFCWLSHDVIECIPFLRAASLIKRVSFLLAEADFFSLFVNFETVLVSWHTPPFPPLQQIRLVQVRISDDFDLYCPALLSFIRRIRP